MNCINLQPESKVDRRRRLGREASQRCREKKAVEGVCRECPNVPERGATRCQACSQRHRLQGRRSYAADPQSKLRQNKAYYTSHPDKVSAKGAKRWARHKVRMARYLVLWRERNPDKEWARKNRRHARKLGADGTCSAAQLRARIAQYGGLCWIPGCGKAYEAIDHVIPLAKGGSNWPSNLRPICKSHNSVKGSKSPDHFLKKVA